MKGAKTGQVWLRMDKAQGQRKLQAKILEKGLLFDASLDKPSSYCKESGQKMFKLSLEQEAYSKGGMKAQKGFNVRAREALKPLDGPWLDVFG